MQWLFLTLGRYLARRAVKFCKFLLFGPSPLVTLLLLQKVTGFSYSRSNPTSYPRRNDEPRNRLPRTIRNDESKLHTYSLSPKGGSQQGSCIYPRSLPYSDISRNNSQDERLLCIWVLVRSTSVSSCSIISGTTLGCGLRDDKLVNPAAGASFTPQLFSLRAVESLVSSSSYIHIAPDYGRELDGTPLLLFGSARSSWATASPEVALSFGNKVTPGTYCFFLTISPSPFLRPTRERW